MNWGLLIGLAVLNIPLYLFLAWVIFDTADKAADTFVETIFVLLRMLLVPRLVRFLLGWDDSGAIGALPIAGFFFACGGIVYCEYLLINKYLLGG